jgi:hypothetical protein
MKGYKESKIEECLRLQHKKSKCEVGRRHGRWNKEREKENCLKNEQSIKNTQSIGEKLKKKYRKKVSKNKLQ